VIDSSFPLAKARAAFERVMMPGKRGKVVLQVVDDWKTALAGGSEGPAQGGP
jgi:hypothetical protein